MKKISSVLQQVLLFVPRLISAAHFMAVRFPDFIAWGGIAVETPFQYLPTDRTETRRPAGTSDADRPGSHDYKNFLFRTTIQLDGDVIHFLPDPDLFPHDAHWKQVYEEKYGIHRRQVSRLLSRLDGVPSMSWALSAVASLTPTIVLGKWAVGAVEALPEWSFIAVLPIITYLVKRCFVGHIFRLGVHAIGFLMKKKMWPARSAALQTQ